MAKTLEAVSVVPTRRPLSSGRGDPSWKPWCKALGCPSTLSDKQTQDVCGDLATGMSVSATVRKFATSRQTIMRVRDEGSRSVRP